jgi:hypothetical protein
MNKKIIVLLFVIFALLSFNVSYAETITLPNGQTLNIDNLNETEITQAIKTARKSMQTKEEIQDTIEAVSKLDPTELNEWRQLITGTIKDICNDLNVTVNEFVKTPVGFGVAILVFYKFMGADLLDNVFDFIIMVPLWMFFTGVILFFGWKFYGSRIYYEISYNEKGKKEKSNPKRIPNHEWKSPNAKEGFAYVLWIAEFVITLTTLLIVL